MVVPLYKLVLKFTWRLLSLKTFRNRVCSCLEKALEIAPEILFTTTLAAAVDGSKVFELLDKGTKLFSTTRVETCLFSSFGSFWTSCNKAWALWSSFSGLLGGRSILKRIFGAISLPVRSAVTRTVTRWRLTFSFRTVRLEALLLSPRSLNRTLSALYTA